MVVKYDVRVYELTLREQILAKQQKWQKQLID